MEIDKQNDESIHMRSDTKQDKQDKWLMEAIEDIQTTKKPILEFNFGVIKVD